VSSLDYNAALTYLASLSSFGMQPGLDRLACVLERLGSPQHRVPAIHIAGTNGKGSTSAFAATIAQVASQRAETRLGRCFSIGLYTSPHLHRVTERIRFSQHGQLRECQKPRFADAVHRVRNAALLAPSVTLTFFEVLTAAAFLVFSDEQVSLAVFETGLGGRLDATRLCSAQVTVVTSIGLDHTEWLGSTLQEIAHEKAGIFRPNIPALATAYDPAARQALCEHARQVGAPLWMWPWDAGSSTQPLPRLPEEVCAHVPLLGAHQRDNAAMAVAALSFAQGPLQDDFLDEDVINTGLDKTRWPGRLETIVPTARTFQAFADRDILLDAAHNPEGACVLARWLSQQQSQRTTILCGVVVGKHAEGMGSPLAFATDVFLCCPPTPRGLPAGELAKIAAFSVGTVVEDWRAAFLRALEHVAKGQRLVVYGSIFLVGAVRALLLDEPTDTLFVQDPGKKP